MPTFAFPAALDDPDAHPDAIRLMFELGRVVLAAHLLERKAANLWMDLSPAKPATWLDKSGRFPRWGKILAGLTATVEEQLESEPSLAGVLNAVEAARRAQERRDRLIHDLTGLDLDRDPPALVRLEWDAGQRRHEVPESASAIRDAVDQLRWAGQNLGTHTKRLRGLGLLHRDVAGGDWD